MKTVQHRIPNGAGWSLSIFQTWDETRLVRSRNPVLIVPGYGMNSFIFSYHPRGRSLESYLASEGFEVWRADFRGQGESVSISGTGDDFSLEDLALTDLRAAIDATLSRTHTDAARVDLVGVSLGGTIMFIHVALQKDHRVGAMVGMGSPVRWVKIHPVLRVAFGSPTLVGLVDFKGTRRMAEVLLPRLARHTPSLLRVYMNPTITDTSAAHEMVKTVEDPNRHVNRQIAAWIRDRDLFLRGKNISESLREIAQPLLCVLANKDGIVPPETAEFSFRQIGSQSKSLIQVGSDDHKMAHADLFISNECHDRVFRPISTWLVAQNESGESKTFVKPRRQGPTKAR